MWSDLIALLEENPSLAFASELVSSMMTYREGTPQHDSDLAEDALRLMLVTDVTPLRMADASDMATPDVTVAAALKATTHRRNRSAVGSEAFLTGLPGVLTPTKGSSGLQRAGG